MLRSSSLCTYFKKHSEASRLLTSLAAAAEMGSENCMSAWYVSAKHSNNEVCQHKSTSTSKFAAENLISKSRFAS